MAHEERDNDGEGSSNSVVGDTNSNNNDNNNNKLGGDEGIEMEEISIDYHDTDKQKDLDKSNLDTKNSINNTDQQQPQKQQTTKNSVEIYFINYFSKWKGGEKSPDMVSYEEMFWSWFGSSVGIGVLAVLHYNVTERKDMNMLIASFAASAVLIFAAIKSPLAQPRNLIGGHFISAVIGVSIKLALFDVSEELACFLAVSISIVAMHLTKTLHPPGGATALVAVMSSKYRWSGYYFVFVPVTSGALTMLVIAMIVNNISPRRKYPVFWW
eukprot:gene3246-4064_t